ncbi:Bacterial type II/III secretion system short domain protein [Thalassoglobus neptunius]|uniref:Bacterial type II/III secretion system short domain protein n=1 Tax=Thalassoglobus neptunius TaxID=1938619 RepID=A0A5C5WYB1_9PLAN|nr:secretin N-terminal domain-containing protein [Thalassoglobus neptunius]TWT55588.1 Bacterial type II/III secretion system short domain protein [Thalassoglobus neptunius]
MRFCSIGLTFGVLLLLAPASSFGQAKPVIVKDGKVIESPGVPPSSAQPANAPSSKTPPGTPNGEKPDQPDKKSEDKGADASSKVIKRTEYEPEPDYEPAELILDPEGKVQFSFHGAKWPVVLNWLAKFSQLNLDWQELPGDFLNLRTQHSYTAEEARDVINRHLLARGYTLLQHGELLTVVKIQNLDPGLVPRVAPEDLLTILPHEFVKVSLPLDWILAEEAVEQLQPMLSQNGKLSAIPTVNRLEAMDAAGNLREIYKLLTEEQRSSQTEKGLVREFRIEHVRAGKVFDSLFAILGIRKPDTAGGGGSLSFGASQQIMRQLQQMQQQMQRNNSPNNSGGKGGPPEEPRLVLNERENSILAHASPDKMEIISQTVKALDVPSPDSSHILQNLDRMRVYHLSTLKPDPLVQILTEVGDLSPSTRVQVDSENNAIIVFGTLADHVTVQSLVDRLDGSSRSFEVIPLRRLRAAEVAGTIQYMFGEEEEEEDQSSKSRYYGFYSSYGQKEEKSKEQRPFKVDADVENNRLLVWANEMEFKEIENLLSKMGEISLGQPNPATARSIDLHSDETARKILERLQNVWEQRRQNPLRIDLPPDAPVEPETEQPELKKEARRKSSSPISFAVSETVRTKPESEPELSAEEKALLQKMRELEAGPPDIRIRQLPDGRLTLESDDTQALDEIEMLISELVPPAPEYKIFQIKYAWPFGIELLLDDFFSGDEDEETILDWWGNSVTMNKQGPERLSSKRKLRIISDDDSRTLLVQNATNEQLALIEDLLEIYDRPETNDPQAVRLTQVFHLEYSQASVVAETIKSVYRDLLSSNDPALQNKNQEGKSPPQQQGFTYIRGGNQDKDDSAAPEEPIKFKGLLSVGIDDLSNTLVISAASGLMSDLAKLVDVLDQAARPDLSVRVVPVNPAMNASVLRDQLNQSFGISAKPSVGVSSTSDRNKSPEKPAGRESKNSGKFNPGEGNAAPAD